jgi:uncharacterized protein YbjQ (UPF0145 family)
VFTVRLLTAWGAAACTFRRTEPTAGFPVTTGEVKQYTELLEDSRRHAVDRMIENARLLGANAVIAMRFDSSEIGQQLTEIVAYGSAVTVAPQG